MWDSEDLIKNYYTEETNNFRKLLHLLRITNYPKMRLRKNNNLFKSKIEQPQVDKVDVRNKLENIKKLFFFNNLT